MEAPEIQPSLDLEVAQAYFMDYNAAQIIWDLVTIPERN